MIVQQLVVIPGLLQEGVSKGRLLKLSYISTQNKQSENDINNSIYSTIKKYLAKTLNSSARCAHSNLGEEN